jgi:hypothetical protein
VTKENEIEDAVKTKQQQTRSCSAKMKSVEILLTVFTVEFLIIKNPKEIN